MIGVHAIRIRIPQGSVLDAWSKRICSYATGSGRMRVRAHLDKRFEESDMHFR